MLSSYGYIYDDNGNRTQQTEINGAGSEITDYVFDEEDRLQHVIYPETKVTYNYDLNYNRISETETQLSDNSVIKQQKSHYNSRNQLTHIDDQLDSANNITYHYDDNGNQTSKVKAGETTNFIVNARDDIEKITIGGSTVGQFLYDHKGMRIQKIGEQGNVRYTYDDASVLLQTDTDNSLLASYQYGPNRLLSLKKTGKEAEYYLFDALGSPVNLTTAAGEITARYQYDAWGHKRNETSTSWNRFGFTGHEEDKETGLIYAKARYYDPDTGRFLSQDAFEGFDNRPPSLHKYLYAYGNPVYYTDPDGLAVRPIIYITSVNRHTDIISPIRSVDTGSYAVDLLGGVGSTVYNVAGLAVNGAFAALATPSFALSAATGDDFERTDMSLLSASMSNPYTMAVGMAYRSPRILARILKQGKKASSLSKIDNIPLQSGKMLLEGKSSIANAGTVLSDEIAALRRIASRNRSNETRDLLSKNKEISDSREIAKANNWKDPKNPAWHNWPNNKKGFDAILGSTKDVKIEGKAVLSRYIRKLDLKDIKTHNGMYNPKYDKGSYTSPVGTPFENRALPSIISDYIEIRFKVKNSFQAKRSKASPWFERRGNATQFEHNSISKLEATDDIEYLGEY